MTNEKLGRAIELRNKIMELNTKVSKIERMLKVTDSYARITINDIWVDIDIDDDITSALEKELFQALEDIKILEEEYEEL